MTAGSPARWSSRSCSGSRAPRPNPGAEVFSVPRPGDRGVQRPRARRRARRHHQRLRRHRPGVRGRPGHRGDRRRHPVGGGPGRRRGARPGRRRRGLGRRHRRQQRVPRLGRGDPGAGGTRGPHGGRGDLRAGLPRRPGERGDAARRPERAGSTSPPRSVFGGTLYAAPRTLAADGPNRLRQLGAGAADRHRRRVLPRRAALRAARLRARGRLHVPRARGGRVVPRCPTSSRGRASPSTPTAACWSARRASTRRCSGCRCRPTYARAMRAPAAASPPRRRRRRRPPSADRRVDAPATSCPRASRPSARGGRGCSPAGSRWAAWSCCSARCGRADGPVGGPPAGSGVSLRRGVAG